MPSFVTHLESALDGTPLAADRVQSTHRDRPLWVRYDLDAVARAVTRDDWARRPPELWRYAELLPLPDAQAAVSLGERISPLVPCPRLGASLGLARLTIKDESQLPTGSFKSRGLALAVSMARHFGLKRLAIPTNGNAGGALAAYAARAGLEAYVFMPADTPVINQYECALYGARTFLVEGLITDCGALVRAGCEAAGWFDVSTLREPYRIEGKKTMGLELAEQCQWSLPDVILYPTGGGTGLIGMWKAFAELAALGWLATDRLPRMVAVQSSGCAPIVRAWEAGERFAAPVTDAATIAAGIRVPSAVGDFMILDAIRESGGRAVAVDEAQIRDWMQWAAATEGIAICPEAAACVGAAEMLIREGWLAGDEHVVLFNTGAAQKYAECLRVELPRLPRYAADAAIDYSALVAR